MSVFATTAAAVATTMASVPATASAAASSVASSTAGTGTIESIVTSVVPSMIASVLPSAVTTTTPVTAAPLQLPLSFEIAAIFAGALTGGMAGVNRRLDITGVATLALVNGLGGGLMRDVLIGNGKIFALETPSALLAVLIGALIASFFYAAAEKLTPAVLAIDSLSLSLFCLVGADKALVAGMNPIAAAMLGLITAVGGGVLRDVLTGRVPEVMQPGELYALPAAAGSAAYVLLVRWLPVAKPVALVVAGLLVFGLRMGSLWRGWTSPEPIDLTPAVADFHRRTFGRLFGRRDEDEKP